MNTVQSLDVTNPSTGKLFRSVDADTMASATQKLDNAYQAFGQTQKLALHERIDLLEKLIVHIEANQEQFIETMVGEGGKPYADSVVEFNRAVQGIKLAIHSVSEDAGSTIPLGYQASSSGRIANTKRFPRGVVLAFSAFNHPLNLVIHQIIPAFAAGCPCIVKPASDTPLSCLMLVEAMHHVGIPKDYIEAVLTADLDVATMLVESDKLAFFSFIGSARVGWMLRGKLHPGVRCALEHGGVAPCFVSEKADIDAAVASITKGAFYHAGQVCVSTQRIFVQETIAKEFTQKLKDAASKLVVGDAVNKNTDVGPLIRPNETIRIHQWVTDAIQNGADCVLGGKPIDDNFYPPTILVNPPSTSQVSHSEIFGPVVCIYTYEKLEDALNAANHEKFAFQAAIFSQDLSEILFAYERVEASAFMVNDHTAFRDDVMPFAGLKESGLGVGGIPYTIEEMQYEKMLVLK